MKGIANFVGFQCAWFACVLGAAHDRPLVGAALALALLAVHFVAFAGARAADARLVAIAVVLGGVADSALLAAGWIEYRAPLAGVLAPLWILVLWAWFAATMRHSLAWLHPRPCAAALLGLVGGPLSYLAGERLGALRFIEPRARGLVAAGVVFCVATLSLSRLAVASAPRQSS